MAEKAKDQGDELTPEEHEIVKHVLIDDSHNESAEQMSLSMRQTDQDYRHEIARLEVSRKRYSAQVKALKSQMDILRRFNARHSTSSSSPARSFSQKALSEAQYSRTFNDETISTLRSRLQTSASTLASLSQTAPLHVSERLKEHDRTISVLSTPDHNHATSANDSTAESSRIDLLAKSLVKLRSEALCDRLDRVFLEALRPLPTEVASSHPSPAEIQVLENDIHSLYIEIDDVLSMLVSQQYLQPLKSSLDQVKASEEQLRNEHISNSIRTLSKLTTELSKLEEHIKAIRSSRIFLLHLSKHLQQIDHGVRRTLKPSEDAKGGGPSTSKAEHATKRFLDHIGAANNAAASAPEIAAATTTTKKGLDDILNLLSSAAQTRTAAIAALRSTPDSSATTSAQLQELERRIEAARQSVAKHSS